MLRTVLLRRALQTSQSHRQRIGDDKQKNNLFKVIQPVNGDPRFISWIQTLTQRMTPRIWLKQLDRDGGNREGTLSIAWISRSSSKVCVKENSKKIKIKKSIPMVLGGKKKKKKKCHWSTSFKKFQEDIFSGVHSQPKPWELFSEERFLLSKGF